MSRYDLASDLAMWVMQSDVFITGVNFSEDQIQVSYLENRKQQVDSAIMETMMINLPNNPRWRETFIALQESLKDLIDDVLVHQRTDGQVARNAAVKTPQERMLQAQEEAAAAAARERSLRELLGNSLGEVPEPPVSPRVEYDG